LNPASQAAAPGRHTGAWRHGGVGLLAVVYAILWTGGVAHHWLYGGVRPEHNWIASLFLLLAGVIVVAGAPGQSARLRLAGAAVLGFAAEVVGSHTGFPFGAYQYTDALRPQLFGVRLVMTCAWMSLFAYVDEMGAHLRAAAWFGAPLAAVWMTAIDLVIDPLAANQLGYWRWANSGLYYGIPATNFAGWLLVSLVACVVLRRGEGANPWARFVGVSITLFFTLLAAVHALYLAAVIGVALCLLHVLVARVPRAASPLDSFRSSSARA
jgi:putative membrane protein